jgi:hypothetical protein
MAIVAAIISVSKSDLAFSIGVHLVYLPALP